MNKKTIARVKHALLTGVGMAICISIVMLAVMFVITNPNPVIFIGGLFCLISLFFAAIAFQDKGRMSV